MTEQALTGMTDDEVIAYTQKIRTSLIATLTPDGKLPSDPKEQQVLLAALSDMDRAAISNKRLKSDDRNADTAKFATQLIGKMFDALGNSNPFIKEVSPEHMQAQALPEHPPVLLENVKEAPGELEVGVQTLDYNTFMNENGR